MILFSQIIYSIILFSVIGGAVYGLRYVWTHPVSILAKWKQEAKSNFPSESDDTLKPNIAKLKINRAFEDFNKAVDEIAFNFPKESNKIANLFNAHNVLSSGEHIQKQMDLSISMKKALDKQ